VNSYLVPSSNAKFEADKKAMMDLTNESKPTCHHLVLIHLTLPTVIRKRKESGIEIDDLLGLMLMAKDPETGVGLSDESIANNLVTFLIAGHETTSGLLSFAVGVFVFPQVVLTYGCFTIGRSPVAKPERIRQGACRGR
jgi:cytochrome P450 / NADPH-cytochrome P450 reductase